MSQIQRFAKCLFSLIFFLVVSGCASIGDTSPAERRTLYPPLTPELEAKLASAKTCEKPGTAAVDKVGPDFTYGCFCGQSHPEYKHKTGTHYSELALSERLELVGRFYNDEPIDDIDAACRDHDVCWVYTGREDADCNVEFFNRLQTISEEMETRLNASGGGYDSTEARCMAFSNGIGQVFLTHIIDNDYDGVGEAVFSNVQRILLTPVAIGKLLVETFRSAVLGKEVFPRDGETCRITSGKEGLYPPKEFDQPQVRELPSREPARRIAVSRR